MIKSIFLINLAIFGLLGNTPQLASKTIERPKVLPTPTVIINYIIKIQCALPDNKAAVGTAFYLGKGKFATAYHVIEDSLECWEASTRTPLVVGQVDAAKDIATIVIPDNQDLISEGFKVNCEGYKNKKIYNSFGFALGAVFVMNQFKATNKFTDDKFYVKTKNYSGMRKLEGFLIPGMSGGPVVNDRGEVVGINNVTSEYGTKAFSTELKNTFLCKQSK